MIDNLLTRLMDLFCTSRDNDREMEVKSFYRKFTLSTSTKIHTADSSRGVYYLSHSIPLSSSGGRVPLSISRFESHQRLEGSGSIPELRLILFSIFSLFQEKIEI